MSAYQVTYGAGYRRAAERRVFTRRCSFLLWRPAAAWREAPSSTPAAAARREGRGLEAAGSPEGRGDVLSGVTGRRGERPGLQDARALVPFFI